MPPQDVDVLIAYGLDTAREGKRSKERLWDSDPSRRKNENESCHSFPIPIAEALSTSNVVASDSISFVHSYAICAGLGWALLLPVLSAVARVPLVSWRVGGALDVAATAAPPPTKS